MLHGELDVIGYKALPESEQRMVDELLEQAGLDKILVSWVRFEQGRIAEAIYNLTDDEGQMTEDGIGAGHWSVEKREFRAAR